MIIKGERVRGKDCKVVEINSKVKEGNEEVKEVNKEEVLKEYEDTLGY